MSYETITQKNETTRLSIYTVIIARNFTYQQIDDTRAFHKPQFSMFMHVLLSNISSKHIYIHISYIKTVSAIENLNLVLCLGLLHLCKILIHQWMIFNFFLFPPNDQ